ncbi:hypothetical protein JNUCC42_11400 [Brevibacterium sp. JNUCC-42]|nr:hypothetical protein JNUCC42_11400 [Brevibacterium sp. JNUCC-42]
MARRKNEARGLYEYTDYGELGIKDKSQIKTWLKWFRNVETYRFAQQVGRDCENT